MQMVKTMDSLGRFIFSNQSSSTLMEGPIRSSRISNNNNINNSTCNSNSYSSSSLRILFKFPHMELGRIEAEEVARWSQNQTKNEHETMII